MPLQLLFTVLKSVPSYLHSSTPVHMAGTWEGVRCAEALEKDGIKTNIALVSGASARP